MSNSTLSRLLKRTLYDLKRRYGGRIDVYRLISSDTSARTGLVTTVKESYPIDRAVILPGMLSRIEERTISIISANKQLLQGGQYEGTARTFLIDQGDLPIELTTDDWIVFDGQRYAIEKVQPYGFDDAWIVNARALAAESPDQIFHLRAESFIHLSGAADAS